MKKFNSHFPLLIVIIFLISLPLFSQENGTSITEADSTVSDSLKPVENSIVYKIGDLADGNKSVPVHLIKLYDENGFSITPNDRHQVPFSSKNTCGDCHTYEIIKEGTHFSIDKLDTTGRKGEPFIYSNHRTLTTLPLSYREWDGSFNPDSVGLSPFQFIKQFGSHFTGGNITENKNLEELENYFRWEVSGKLEINCLVCHDSDPEYDQAEFASQLKKENFKWAASAASSISKVKGYAGKMPDNFDIYNTNTYVDVDLRTTPAPSIKYNDEDFDEDNKVFFDIDKNIDNKRCQFCHSSTLNSDDLKFIVEQEDVHISSGMSCVDCHKNGMDHKIIVGYENENVIRKNEMIKSFTCEGCHLSTEENKYSGRYGAPNPLHKGIPSLHFEKLSCTVCHSSYYPEDEARLLKTSRAHKLGVPGPNKMPSTFPLIQSPVFVRAENGKIEPHNLIWPSYWAFKNENKISPLDINFVEQNIQPLLALDTVHNFGDWPVIDDTLLVSVLDSANSVFNEAGSIVYISGGKLHEIKDENKLSSKELRDAKPYTWPIAHNVRPAQQSLGINGCDDCHSVDSDFYFGDVNVIASIKSEGKTKISMTKFEDLNSVYQGIFSFSFYFRPIFKYMLILSAVIILLVVLTYTFSGVKAVARYLSADLRNNGDE